MATKKPTNKDRDQQIAWLMQNLQGLSHVLSQYIDFKDDGAEFKKFLIDLAEKKKKEQNDTKTSDRSGDKSDS